VSAVHCNRPMMSRNHAHLTAPRLLVSVRDAAEVDAALAGGTDILDVKDPSAGSLGRPQPHVLANVAALLQRIRPQAALSVAWGELMDDQAQPPGCLPSPIGWVKIGLAGCADQPLWQQRLREWCLRAGKGADCRESAAPMPALRLVVASYADFHAARAPAPQAVLEAALDTGCAGVLLDTFSKQGGRLKDFISPRALADWLTTARRHGLQTAVAGSLTVDDLEWIVPLRPDIVAIRSAACRDGRRAAPIDAQAVQHFQQSLHARWYQLVRP